MYTCVHICISVWRLTLSVFLEHFLHITYGGRDSNLNPELTTSSQLAPRSPCCSQESYMQTSCQTCLAFTWVWGIWTFIHSWMVSFLPTETVSSF